MLDDVTKDIGFIRKTVVNNHKNEEITSKAILSKQTKKLKAKKRKKVEI